MFYSNFEFQRAHNNQNHTIERIKLRYEDPHDFLLKLGYGWRADKNININLLVNLLLINQVLLSSLSN